MKSINLMSFFLIVIASQNIWSMQKDARQKCKIIKSEQESWDRCEDEILPFNLSLEPARTMRVATKKKSSDDSELNLKTPRESLIVLAARSSSDNDVLKPVNKKSAKKISLKGIGFKKSKKSSGFEHRKKLYRDRFSEINSAFEMMFPAERQAIGSEQFAALKKLNSRSKIYGFLRESNGFSDEYKILRIATKKELLPCFDNVINHDLDFLDNPHFAEYFNSILLGENLRESDIEKIFDVLSSNKTSIARQENYLVFLENHILPMVRNTPKDVRRFFYNMANSTRTAMLNIVDEKDAKMIEINPFELATSNLMLYVIAPLLSNMRSHLISFPSKELKKYEEKELVRMKLEGKIERGTKEEEELVEGVFSWMNINKISLISSTYKDEFREIKERSLQKLLLKTFKAQSQFQISDYQGFLGEFYVLLGKEGSPLNERLKIFKNNVQVALFDGLGEK